MIRTEIIEVTVEDSVILRIIVLSLKTTPKDETTADPDLCITKDKTYYVVLINVFKNKCDVNISHPELRQEKANRDTVKPVK